MTVTPEQSRKPKENTGIYLWIAFLNFQSQVLEEGKLLHIENVKKLIKCICSTF